ncbi:hypothetical protein GBAR_LOCUS22613 [Geodia barretti]|uniref:Uncharacterized protein n=1 Tax=Geodia barretti TaxID=519541 RepID=A0AA35T3K0_GEOBA|nr:hypothetical protein GBAR_LOCUS22613 [Geodia barretti]
MRRERTGIVPWQWSTNTATSCPTPSVPSTTSHFLLDTSPLSHSTSQTTQLSLLPPSPPRDLATQDPELPLPLPPPSLPPPSPPPHRPHHPHTIT